MERWFEITPREQYQIDKKLFLVCDKLHFLGAAYEKSGVFIPLTFSSWSNREMVANQYFIKDITLVYCSSKADLAFSYMMIED